VAPWYQGRTLLPVLGKVAATRYTDRVHVRLVSGQSAADFADHADNLAHGFGAVLCRVRTGRPGSVVLELVRRDALAQIIPALPIPTETDLRALPVGKREDGTPWTVRLHGTHLLLAGATGAGKASLLLGLVRVLAADPKLMELAYGRALFDRYGQYTADPLAIVTMLEQAVADMQARAGRLAGHYREHTPTPEYPFTVVLVDEVAFLTAYHPEKPLRERVKAALATLTTQGRAVGYCVVAALQDPRKEVMSIRNLFPDRIAMRLDEPEQVDMVLGDGARDRGASADLISSDPPTGAGVAFIRLETDPDPVRVRAGFVTDPDIRAMCDTYAAPGTRCTSRRCSTGSSRTCAVTSATTSSTSPSSNPSGAWPRTCIWPSVARSPGPNCARSSPRPITRCGGPPPTLCGSTAASSRSGMSHPVPTSTR
jgi:S-DNA-T family DNA segregation ATPase FtsK/SpoIIIE